MGEKNGGIKLELKYLVIILSLVCIIFLYAISSFSLPKEIDLKDIPKFDQKDVIIKGFVTKYYSTQYGSTIIEIRDLSNQSEATIFLEEEYGVEYGDYIQATGKVTQYNKEWEVVVGESTFIKILQKWDKQYLPLWAVANNPEKYIDMNVNTSGIIDRKYDSYFYLMDFDDRFTIAIYCDTNLLMNLTEGQEVSVGGRFIYDSETLRFIIIVNDTNHFIVENERK